MDIIYREENEGHSLEGLFRNGYTLFMSFFYVTFFAFSLSDPIYEGIWMNIYTWLLWLPPIALYLTPSFQNFFLSSESFDKSKHNMRIIWNIFLYPLLYIPLIGSGILAVIGGMRFKTKWDTTYEKVRNYKDLKEKISEFEATENLQADKNNLLEDIEDREPLEEIEKRFEELKRSQANQFNEKIDNFIDKYGKGNPDQIEKLKKLINRERAVNLDYERVKDMIHSAYKERQRQQFNSKLNSYETESYDDTLEAFVKEFGTGDQQTLDHLRQYSGKNNVKSDVKNKFEEMRDEKELKRFKEELNSSEGARNLLGEIEDNHIDWKDIQRMDGLDFEDIVADLFDAKGYDAWVTSGSGDQGADVVAEKDFEKVTIQAKRYKGKVSNSAVQEVVASMKHYNADRGLVITNSKFTSSAKELASSNDVELWNGRKLKEQIEKYLNKNGI